MFRNIFSRQRNDDQEPVQPETGLGDAMMGAVEEGLLGEGDSEVQPQAAPAQAMPNPFEEQPAPRRPQPPQPQPPQQRPRQPQQEAQQVFVREEIRRLPDVLKERMASTRQRKAALIEKMRTASSLTRR